MATQDKNRVLLVRKGGKRGVFVEKKKGNSGFESEETAQTGYVIAGCPSMCWAVSGFSGL